MDGVRSVLLWLPHRFARLAIEFPASQIGIDRLIEHLEKSGESLQKRTAAVQGQKRNQEILANMIGIERWGQRRLKIVLGEPMVTDAHHQYRPSVSDWQNLQEAFQKARQGTIALGKCLRMAGIDPNTRVSHNLFGEITLLGWLFYLSIATRITSIWFN